MSDKIVLERNSKVFKMANGKMLIISSEDYGELVTAIIAEMLANGDNRVYLIKDAPLERAKLMQNVYNDSKGDMSESTKNKYLQEILSLLKKNDYDIITLKAMKEEQAAIKDG